MSLKNSLAFTKGNFYLLNSCHFEMLLKPSRSFSFKKNVHCKTMSQKTNSKFLKVQDYRSINVYYATL